jgi:hypothetical protein
LLDILASENRWVIRNVRLGSIVCLTMPVI